MTYHSRTFHSQRIVSPADHPPALGVHADSTQPSSIIGIAFPVAHIGGMKWQNPTADYPPPEVVWRLEIDRAWVEGKVVDLEAKQVLDGRFVLRLGVFVELVEGAV